MGQEGGEALAAAIPNCPRLRFVGAGFCDLGEDMEAKLEALSRPVGHPEGLLQVMTGMRLPTPLPTVAFDGLGTGH